MKLRQKQLTGAAGLAFLLTLNGCDLSPDYQAQDLVVPESWQGELPPADLQPQVQTPHLEAGWWKQYNDPILNDLQEKAIANNADLQAAAERFQQARDDMMRSRARLMPKFGVMINTTEPLASWEPDVWSAIRNETRAESVTAQQMAAEYAAARLSLQTEIARHYFTLRALDAQTANYTAAIGYYKKSLNIVETRVNGMISPRLDLVRAQTLLYTTQAEQLDIEAQRQIVEHALAILVNTSPSSFHIDPIEEKLDAKIPDIPLSIPSELLQRRPDIASAERQMARANHLIGAKVATFYPDFELRIDGEEPGLGVEWPWFEGGMRRAELQQARSMYREASDNYRSTVLNAFREVEDGLTEVSQLNKELVFQRQAVEAATQAQTMTMDLYKGGISNSLEMIVAQVNTLEAHTKEITLQMHLLQASTDLIKAMGGGWDREQLPKDDEIQPFGTLQYTDMEKSEPAGGIEAETDMQKSADLTDGSVTTTTPSSK